MAGIFFFHLFVSTFNFFALQGVPVHCFGTSAKYDTILMHLSCHAIKLALHCSPDIELTIQVQMVANRNCNQLHLQSDLKKIQQGFTSNFEF